MRHCTQLAKEQAQTVARSHEVELREVREQYERMIVSTRAEHTANIKLIISERDRLKEELEVKITDMAKEHEVSYRYRETSLSLVQRLDGNGYALKDKKVR